jgi:hypothetical protein
MTISPGEEALAADITGRFRVGTGFEDTDSSTFTTSATVIASATAQLVSGRTYHVKVITHLGSSVAADTATLSLKEDSVSGTEIQGATGLVLTTSAAGGYFQIETDFTAVATGSKTFVATALRASGSGNLRREAAAIRPTWLTVDYAYG